LTLADAKQGIEMVKSQFQREEINGQTYWFAEAVTKGKVKSQTVYLLPNYDEYFIGFKDRSAIGQLTAKANIQKDDPSFLAHILILDGQVAGGWKRTQEAKQVLVEVNPVIKLAKVQKQAISAAAERYGNFLGLPVKLTYKEHGRE
jgi:hypothetical protein